MTEDRTPRASDEPTTATKQRKKRKWDQPAEDVVSAVAAAAPAAVAGLPLLNTGALCDAQFPGTTAYPATPMMSAVPAPYALPPQFAPSVLQSAAAVIHKLSQAKIPDELIAREVVINYAGPYYRYKLKKRRLLDDIQRCTSTVIIKRGKYHPPNGQPHGEKPLYLHISAGSQLKDTAERIKAVDHAVSMIEEILKQGQMTEAIQSNRQAIHFSASNFSGFAADPSLNVAAGPNYDRISSSKVYGAVPPLQQLLAGVRTSGTTSDIHSILGPYVPPGASHSFAPAGITSPMAAPSVTLHSGTPIYSGTPPPSNLICPSQAANGGALYNGYGSIYPQGTPLQQVALALKHASSSTTQVVPVASTSTSLMTNVNESAKLESDKRPQRRKFQELPTADLQNSQQGSKFVKTSLDGLGTMSSSSVAPKMKIQPGSNGIPPQDPQHGPSHMYISTSMPPPPPSKILSPPYSMNMPPPPPRSMPPPPPKFPSNEVLRNEERYSAFKEPMAPPRSFDVSSVSARKVFSAQLPSSNETKEGKPSSASVSDTLLKLMDYGDDDDDDDDIVETDNVPQGKPDPSSGWSV